MLSSDAARRHHRSTRHQQATIVTAIQNKYAVDSPFNAGIKSLRVTLRAKIFLLGIQTFKWLTVLRHYK
jgi:hypothetical protein